MSIGDPASQKAWDALATVQGHTQVRQWLAESDARAGSRRTNWRRWAVAASVALAVGIAATYGYSWFVPRSYETAIGEQRDIVLKDGSLVTLNTDTAIAVRYTDNRRHIELRRGEALFAVKQDRTRPFEVSAGATLTRAIGTEFNIDMRQDKVTVSVIDGAVRVSAGQNGRVSTADLTPIATLGKGQAVEFPAQLPSLQVARAADLDRIDAWRTRRLEFSDTPLASAVEEFNRYSTTRVTIGTPGLESVRVSGVFRIGDTEGFLYSLREALGVRTHEGTDEVVLMR